MSCPVCLEVFGGDVLAVCPPCGHVICEGCMVDYIDRQDDPSQIPCPSCKVDFALVNLDQNWIPERYHRYLQPPIRKVFFPGPDVSAQETIDELTDRMRNLQESLAQSEANVEAHGQAYQAAREEVNRLQGDIQFKNTHISALANALEQKTQALNRTESKLRDAAAVMEAWNANGHAGSSTSTQRYQQNPQSAHTLGSLPTLDTSYYPSGSYTHPNANPGSAGHARTPTTASFVPSAVANSFPPPNSQNTSYASLYNNVPLDMLWNAARNSTPGPPNPNQNPRSGTGF